MSFCQTNHGICGGKVSETDLNTGYRTVLSLSHRESDIEAVLLYHTDWLDHLSNMPDLWSSIKV